LGVIVAIKSSIEQQQQLSLPPIHAVSGSSSGSIAATLFAYFSHEQVQEYANKFISDGGRAMHHLKQLVIDANASAEARYYRNSQQQRGSSSSSCNACLADTQCSAERYLPDSARAMSHLREMIVDANANNGDQPLTLHIATTRCSDGSLHCFNFPSNLSSSSFDIHTLLQCLEASCKIPPHFHPVDVIQNNKWGSSSLTYPEEDGICINGIAYVDGGISAPAPPTPIDMIEGACRVIISPISGSLNSSHHEDVDEDGVSSAVLVVRISPSDNSWKLPLDIKCKGGFNVYPSIQNFKAMQISAGLATPPILQEWYDRGFNDATKILLLS
jgi:predicted acylesterase/phospholipase RssA